MPTSRIAYILSRYPVLTETFITEEIAELRRKDIDVNVFSLKGPKRDETFHGNTAELITSTHYYPYLLSLHIWKGVIHYLSMNSEVCLDILIRIIRTHIKNPIQLLKTLAIMPKTFAIAKEIQESGITRIHAHWATIPTTAAWMAAKLNNITYSFTAHAWDIFQIETMLAEKIRDASSVITISEYNKQYLMKKYPTIHSDKIKIVHCGVDLKKYSLQHPINDDIFRILSIGRMTEKKGFVVLLYACKILKEDGIPFRCRIVYVRGNYEDKFFSLYKQLGISDHVELIPELPQGEIIKQYCDADCFVLPCIIAGTNDRDGIPVVILEAMAMELPVVSTSVSGIPEVIENGVTGLLAKPGDVFDLAHAIQQLYLDSELRTKLGKAGRIFVTQQFEISSTVDQLSKIILEERRQQ